jgi:hypothetical protein
MDKEHSAGSRAAQAADLAKKAAAVARTAAMGGKAGAAAETARQFLPQLIKTVVIISVVLILLPIVIFAAIPHFLFGWLFNHNSDTRHMTSLAGSMSAVYEEYGLIAQEEADFYLKSLLAGLEDGQEYIVHTDVRNTYQAWLIAILSVNYQQDLEVIDERAVRRMIRDKMLHRFVYDDDGILNIYIWDMNPDQLMDTLGFNEEQLNWAGLIHTTMSSDSSMPGPVYGTPGTPMGAGAYSDLIAEAEKHLGKPYVWGASGPDAFDCSGFVCYVINQSGVANVGRTTAQGLFNISTPIPKNEAQPGDLIFFTGTYAGPTVTHVGIYSGSGQMLHAGNPISYASINTTYWQRHFYSFGRI